MTAAPARQLPLWRTFLVFLIPLMLSNILQSMSGTLNGVFLGQLIGVEAMAASSAFFPVMFFFMAFAIGLSMGATILIGQAFGARDITLVRQIAGPVFLMVIIGGLVIGVSGALNARALMMALNTPDNILDASTDYARVLMLSLPLMFVFILITSILRGIGDTMTPLWTLVMSTIVGLILTPAFIQGWGGLPRLGAASAAVASVISVFVALAWLGGYMIQRKLPFAPTMDFVRYMRFDGAMLLRVLRLGLPTGVQMIIIALAEIVLIGLANGYGSDVTAAYGATMQVLSYVQFPAMSIGISASILAAQAIGAGRAGSLDAIMRTGQLLNIIITGLGVIVVYLLSRSIIALFITDPDVIDLTDHLISIVLWSTVLFGASVVFSGTMRGSGTVLAPTGLAILAILAVEVPVATWLSGKIGVDGIWWAYPAAFSAMLILQATWYYGVWRRKAIKALI